MEISARNGIKGTVESVKLGAVMDEVKAIIKSTEVMVAK